LPLIGARALAQNHMYITVDYKRCRASMRTTGTFGVFW
jgi:hypothetical protein